MLVDYREFLFFLSASACTSTQMHKYTKSIHSRAQLQLPERHALAQAILTITVMSSKWQTIQGFAVPGSKAGLQLSTKDCDKEFWDIFSFFSLSILLSISLYLPPPIFRSFSIRSSLSPGITNTSAGGRITDKSPGVLDSVTLAGAEPILACRTGCHIWWDWKISHTKQPSSNTIQKTPQDPQSLFTYTHTYSWW